MTQESQTGAHKQPRGVECVGRWEGSSRGRGDIYIHLWLIHDVWQKPTQFCKAIVYSSIKNKFKIKKEVLSFLFAFCHEIVIICISVVVDVSSASLDFCLLLIQPDICHDVFSI